MLSCLFYVEEITMLLTEQAVGSISSERKAKAWFIWTLSYQFGTFSCDHSIPTLYTWIGICSTLLLRKVHKINKDYKIHSIFWNSVISSYFSIQDTILYANSILTIANKGKEHRIK